MCYSQWLPDGDDSWVLFLLHPVRECSGRRSMESTMAGSQDLRAHMVTTITMVDKVHVTIMWLSCDYHVTIMWLSCDCHVTVMWLIWLSCPVAQVYTVTVLVYDIGHCKAKLTWCWFQLYLVSINVSPPPPSSSFTFHLLSPLLSPPPPPPPPSFILVTDYYGYWNEHSRFE